MRTTTSGFGRRAWVRAAAGCGVGVMAGLAGVAGLGGCSAGGASASATHGEGAGGGAVAEGSGAAGAGAAVGAHAGEPIVIGESFTIESAVMGEARWVNVFTPTVYGEAIAGPLPVLLMLDGGVNEDFLHIAGLVQVMVSNGTMRPMRLVGVANPSTAARRRDLTGPTTNAEDRKADAGAGLGESARFREFLRAEVLPAVKARYATREDGGAIVGESLAGLFVLETFFAEPRMFATYVAIDPSLWWSNEALANGAGERLSVLGREYGGAAAIDGVSVWIATGSDAGVGPAASRLARAFEVAAVGGPGRVGVAFRHVPMSAETHATIYHAAAMAAFRDVLGAPGVEKR